MDILSSDFPPEREKNSHGGELTHSHYAKRHIEPLETGGEDFAVISLGVSWKTGYTAFMRKLAEGKELAQKKHEAVTVEAGQFQPMISPSGLKSGGGKGMYYPYILQLHGFTIKIAERTRPVEETPNVVVEMGSLVLTSGRGLVRTWFDFKAVLEEWGGYVLWDKLSRLDLCADLPDMNMLSVYGLVIQENKFLTKAASDVSYRQHLKSRGLTIGSGKILLRMYDKAHEVKVARPDPTKRQLLEYLRWGGPQKSALRVEYQLRREALRQLSIDNIGNYISNRAAAGKYLTHEWFRLTHIKPDRRNGNTKRAPTHRSWRKVQSAFEQWLGESVDTAKRKLPISKDSIRLVQQGGGCFVSAVADLTQKYEITRKEFRRLAHHVIDYYVDEMTEEELQEKYFDKAIRRGVTNPDTEIQPSLKGKYKPWIKNTQDEGVLNRNKQTSKGKSSDAEEHQGDEKTS